MQTHVPRRPPLAIVALFVAAAFGGCLEGIGEQSGEWQATFTPQLDLSLCSAGAANVTLGAGGIVPDLNGEFSDTWGSSATGQVKVALQLNVTGFFGNLKCASSTANGIMSGTFDGSSYAGTYTFGGKPGSVTILRQSRDRGCGSDCTDDCGNQGCYSGCQGPNCGGNNDCGNQGCYNDCQGPNCGGSNDCANQGCNNYCQGPNCGGNDCCNNDCQQNCNNYDCGNNCNNDWSPGGAWLVVFSPQVDISACGPPNRTIASQALQADAMGQFSAVWESMITVTGGLSSGSFNAHVRCFKTMPNGGPTGGMDGGRSGDGFSGHYNFWNNQGSFVVTRGGVSSPSPRTATASPSPTPTSASPTPTSSSPSPTPQSLVGTWHLTFAPSIDVSACGANTSWNTQVVSVGSDGSFTATWSPDRPNTLTVTGTLSGTGFSAQIRCTTQPSDGNATGAMSGGPEGAGYQGGWSFCCSEANSGTVTWTRPT